MDIQQPKIINLPKILNDKGNLTFLEGENNIPFKIIRTYWIYDVPGGEVRGEHAYKSTHEFIIAISGSFDVVLDNFQETKIYPLNRSYFGLYVPNMIWRKLENFSTNSLCLILASDGYDESEYIRDYETFKQLYNA